MAKRKSLWHFLPQAKSSQKAMYDSKTFFSSVEVSLFLLSSYFDSLTISGYSMSIKEYKVNFVLMSNDWRLVHNFKNYPPRFVPFNIQDIHMTSLNRYVKLNNIPQKGTDFCLLKGDYRHWKITRNQWNIRTMVLSGSWAADSVLLLLC